MIRKALFANNMISDSGRFSFIFSVGGVSGTLHKQQIRIKKEIQNVLGEKVEHATHDNKAEEHGEFCWDQFVIQGNTVFVKAVWLEDLKSSLRILCAFNRRGWYPQDLVIIKYSPKCLDGIALEKVRRIIQSRKELLEMALSASLTIGIYENDWLTLGIRLSVFSYPQIEAISYLIEQAYQKALEMGMPRIASFDMSNPKFQMRSWLLRLGFIGKRFEGPRKTLLCELEGDSAFFDSDQKKKAAAQRKAKRMNERKVTE